MLSIYIHEAYIENKTGQFINDISDFNNKHIIHCYNKTISNINEEPRFISYMTPTGFINGEVGSRYYVNLSFQVIFLNIYF